MSFTSKYIEWDVSYEFVSHGNPIGFEVEFATSNEFRLPTYRVTTFEERHKAYESKFKYSLDNGYSWITFPHVDAGVVFNQAIKMRLEINSNVSSYCLTSSNGKIYQLMSNGEKVVKTFNINKSFIDVGYDKIKNVFYGLSNDTIYKIKNKGSIIKIVKKPKLIFN